MGYHAVPSMDAATLLSSAKCHVNFVNVVHYDRVVTEDVIRFNVGKLMKFMPKYSQCFEVFAGEYYYKYLDSDKEKAKEIAFERGIEINRDENTWLRTEEDIDNWAQDNLNKKMPLDGPMWRLYVQEYTHNGKQGSIIIFKSHHSFCDGMSTMSMSLAMSSEYHRSYFVKGADASMFQRLFTRLSFPFMIPFLLWDTAMIRKDNNFLSKNKQMKGFTGIMNCDCTEDMKFLEIKELSKKVGGITINDLIASAISAGLKKLFLENGD